MEALKARVSFEFSREAEAVLQAAASRVVAMPYRPEGRVVAELLVSEGAQSLTMRPEKASRSEPSSTIILRRDRSASVHDHGLRAWVDMPAKDIPRMQVSAPGSIDLKSKKEGDNVLAELTFTDASLGRVRYEMTFSTREDLRAFGPALMYILHGGPGCHETSRIPIEKLAKLGCLMESRAFVEDVRQPVMHMRVEKADVVPLDQAAFEPPKGYRPLADLLREAQAKGAESQDHPKPHRDKPGAGHPGKGAASPDMGGTQHLLMAKRKIEEKLTPDCLGTTRFGSIAAIVHQDVFTHSTTLVNSLAPLIGTATLAGGTMTVPWLASLSAINAGSATAPGSGIFTFLRDRRRPSTAIGGPSGGTGLLDRMAYKFLRTPDASGLTRTQAEAAATTLAATLASWGVSATTAGNLTARAGDLSTLTLDELIEVVEGYETSELGVLTIPGLPSAPPPFTWNGLITISVRGIAGTANFATLAGAPLVTATIGAAGNVAVGLTLPAITLTATLSRSLTAGGWGIVAGVAASCFFFPFTCPATLILAALLAFVLNNVTALTITCTGVSVMLDVSYQWNPATSRLDPFVSVVSTTGTVTVVNTWVTPNIIANLFDSLITSVGNLFNLWVGGLASAAADKMQEGMRAAGLVFPVGKLGLEAEDGEAVSDAGVSLTLSVDVKPMEDLAAQAFITQVEPLEGLRKLLSDAQGIMHHDVNPQPTPAAPGPGLAISVGTYLGIGLSQNALNYYLFSRWLNGDFEVATTDAQLIARIVASAPPNAFVRSPTRIHIWPATPPRAEVWLEGIATGQRPLVVFFDDVRACFEIPSSSTDGATLSGAWEFCFNLKTPGTITLDWPMVFKLLVDIGTRWVQPSDIRSWEFVDLNVPDAMKKYPPAMWQKMADALALTLLAPLDASGVGPPPSPAVWSPPLPSMTQELVKSIPPPSGVRISAQSLYMEILGWRKSLYLMTALQTTLLELVDGSGAPLLNRVLLGHPAGAPAVSIATMSRADGIALRPWLNLVGLRPDVLP